MRRYDRSPMSSPSRKRQKVFSSPVCPDLDLSQEDFQALDQIERILSQSMHSSQHESPSKSSKHTPSDNPFQLSPERLTSAFSGFTAASAIPVTHDDPENMETDPSEEEKDYSSWFDSTNILPAAGFQTAKFTSATTSLFSTASALVDKEQSNALGFCTAGKKLLVPSTEALAKAEAKIRQIWQEDDDEPMPPERLSIRSPLRSVQNSAPETPCPPSHASGFASASQLSNGLARTSGFHISSTTKSSAFVSPVIDKTKSQIIEQNRPKPFKSPLATPAKPSSSSAFVSARFQHPLAAPPMNASFQTPVRSNASILPSSVTLSSTQIPPSMSKRPMDAATPKDFATPARHGVSQVGSATRIRTTPAKFVTPFKKGMKPGEVGRVALEATQRSRMHLYVPAQPTNRTSTTKASSKMSEDMDLRLPSVFDMTSPSNRMSLTESGLFPQQYTADEMIGYNIAIEELSQISTPSLAFYYSFFTTPQPSDSPSVRVEDRIGPTAALERLLAHGCSRATKAWVDNAWCLILWKLAGMVALDPEREASPSTFGGDAAGPRWCWEEVWRQLLYRYEREMNLGIRPPFHLITTQDHPASAPMILCISNIIWPESPSDEQGGSSSPLLEVTDGWYRLKAQIDPTLVQGLKRGKLRIGRKIAVVGCRLDAQRKDPLEPLEAYESMKLILSGNSSQLAPWHAKLGFQRGPYVFTMHSLTSEGGNVAMMDLVVLQVHPVGYLEIRIDADGKKHQEGPRTGADEAVCKNQWRKKREAAESKVYDAHEKKIARYLSYAERLEQKAGRFAQVLSEDAPDSIDSLYDELEEPEDANRVISRTKGSEAAWLVRYIRERLENDQDRAREELEKEVDDLCPPRNIRAFRVILVQDSRTSKFPANRIAQLTIWDCLELRLAEDKPRGHFDVGWRCIVTNLMPSSKSAWMAHEPNSQIFLVSTRASKWQKMQSLG